MTIGYQARHAGGWLHDIDRDHTNHPTRHAHKCPRCEPGTPGTPCRPCAAEIAHQLRDPDHELTVVNFTDHGYRHGDYPADIRRGI